MSEQVFTNLTNCGPVSVYVTDGVVTRIRSAGRRRRVRVQALGDRGGRQEVLSAEEVQPRSDGPRRAPAPVLERAHPVSDEARRLRPQRASATRRTAASRPTSASRWDEALDIVSSEITRVKKTYGSSAISGMTSLAPQLGHRRLQDGPVHALHELSRGHPRASTTRTAGRGGTGAPRTRTASAGASACPSSSTSSRTRSRTPRWSSSGRTTRTPRAASTPARSAHLALLDEGARHQDGVRRPLLQLHDRALRRGQVVRAAPGHRSSLALASPTRGSSRTSTTRSTSPSAPSASTSGRTTSSARRTTCPRRPSGPRASPASPPGRSAPWRASGAPRVMLAAGGLGGWGGACRSANGNEWARTMVALAAMQGYGKPGINIWGISQGAPSDCSFVFPGYAEGGMSATREGGQLRIAVRTRPSSGSTGSPVPDAILNPPEECGRRGKASAARPSSTVAAVRVPGRGCVRRSSSGTLRRLVHRHHDRDQPSGCGCTRAPSSSSSSTSPSGWRARRRIADIILPACTNFER